MSKKQAFVELNELLEPGNFPEGIEKMRSWSKVWLNQFVQVFPHHYEILKLEEFDPFWAERRAVLDPDIAFVKQQGVPDIDLVLGYVFYLISCGAKDKHEDNTFMEHLQQAIKHCSIHAAQTLLHTVLMEETRDARKKMETLVNTLDNLEQLAVKHGTPGYLLLASGYLHLLRIASEAKDYERYGTACFCLWQNLIIAELHEPQSKASTHNAYFGQGLRLSNPLRLETIAQMKQESGALIIDNNIKARAESTARLSFENKDSQDQLLTWIQSRNKRK